MLETKPDAHEQVADSWKSAIAPRMWPLAGRWASTMHWPLGAFVGIAFEPRRLEALVDR